MKLAKVSNARGFIPKMGSMGPMYSNLSILSGHVHEHLLQDAHAIHSRYTCPRQNVVNFDFSTSPASQLVSGRQCSSQVT